jgi:hypothetical protein
MLLHMHQGAITRRKGITPVNAGECLAAVWGVSHFRIYLYGRRFVSLTDHEPCLVNDKREVDRNARHVGTHSVRI